jgi:hypothetical protein
MSDNRTGNFRYRVKSTWLPPKQLVVLQVQWSTGYSTYWEDARLQDITEDMLPKVKQDG